MKVTFKSAKLQKICNNDKRLKQKFGVRCGKLIRQRLSELSAATSLADVCSLLGPHCEELVGDRKGQLSVRVDHPKRIIFRPRNEPTPRKPDGGLNWSEVTEIEIIEIEDYHGN